MAQIKKQMMDVFCDKVQRNFKLYCEKNRLQPNLEQFTTYLLDQGLIDPSAMRHFTILQTYDEIKKNAPVAGKKETVLVLAGRFNVSERSVWGILSKHKTK